MRNKFTIVLFAFPILNRHIKRKFTNRHLLNKQATILMWLSLSIMYENTIYFSTQLQDRLPLQTKTNGYAIVPEENTISCSKNVHVSAAFNVHTALFKTSI